MNEQTPPNADTPTGAASELSAGLGVELQWSAAAGMWSSGLSVFSGKWGLGGVHYDARRSRDEPKKYAATCKLPGIKSLLGHAETEEEAKKWVEKAINHWFAKLTPNAEVTGVSALSARPLERRVRRC